MRLGVRGATAATNRRITLSRALGATVALGVVGAGVGASIGAGMLVAISFATAGPDDFPYLFVYPFARDIGAGLGVIALPYAAWSLPRVSIGRILATTTIGTIIGGAAGFVWIDLLGAMLGAIIGFGCAASWLGIRYSDMWRVSSIP